MLTHKSLLGAESPSHKLYFGVGQIYLVTLYHILAVHFLNEPATFELSLSENVHDFQRRFAGLLCTTQEALNGIDVCKIRIFLNQMCVNQKETIPLYEQRMAEMIKHNSLEEIILFCSRMEVWDFLNFQLLQDVANHFEVECLKADLHEYTIAINGFKQKTKLIDFLRVWAGRKAPNTLPGSEPVFAKIKAIKWEEYTLADVARHEKYLTAEFRLKQIVLRFSNAGKGSVVLMWLVTKSVASEMKTIMCSDKKPTFDSMTFQELNIGGRTFKVLYCLYSCYPSMRNYV